MTKLLIALAMLLATGVAGASERATVTRPAELQDAPYADASRTASVAGNQSVQILLRQGGWYKVRTDAGAEGWLRMFSVRLGSSPTRTETASRDDDSGGWFSFFRRSRTGSRQSTATTGIRGLDSGDIKTAQPDPAAVDRLDRYAVSATQARQFAATGKLRSENVPLLPADPERRGR